MNAETGKVTRGRPRHDEKRQAIEILLRGGMEPAKIHETTGSSLTVIYEVRRKWLLTQQGDQAAA